MANNNDKKVLNVPALRFPEFTGEWEKCKLSKVCSFFSGGTPPSSNKEYYNGNIPFIRSGELHNDETELFITKEGLDNSAAKMVEVGDLLLALYGATSGDIAISKIKGAINQAILCIRTKQNKKFVESVWNKHVARLLQTYLQGGQGNLSADIVKNIPFYFTNIEEQNKLARFISLLDQRIAAQNKIIEKYESLIQAIIYQKKTDGIRKGNWQKTELSKVLQERTEKNINGYTVCSVSVSQGVINQIEYLGRSFAAKETSHYNVVKYGDIVYTKSPTGDFPYGIVKRSYIKNAVAVSPLYGVYKPINDNIGVILHFYFMQPNNAFNYLHPLIQKGAKNTINITNTRFLENSIPLPKTIPVFTTDYYSIFYR
ncbi:restriction endonuclease subunit S [Barnesiella intestinihominis]